MQNTFSKSFDGHHLQFNRFLYPMRYTVKIDEFGSDGKQYEVRKVQNVWCLTDVNGLPEWLKNLGGEINSAIEENEKSFSKLIF